MRNLTAPLTVLGAVLLPLLFAVPAAAQATRTWVSGVGDDVNPCSRTAPCKTFQGAISKTAAGGEIDAIDPGGFGAVTITKAMTIAAEGTGEGGILAAGTNGIIINAGANDMIVLRGLQIDGGPLTSNSLAGVKFIAGGGLVVQNCAIRNFTGPSPNGYGIAFMPSGAASLLVSDTSISSNGNGAGSSGAGIFIQPTTGSAKASIVRTNVVNNIVGIRADSTGSTGGITVSVSDSTVAGNIFGGITAFAPIGGSAVTMNIIRSVSANNGTGIKANGAPAKLRIGYSSVTGNTAGVSILGGATMSSMGNNLITDNDSPGPAIPVVAPL
jgi:hypothetical protein